MLVIVSGAMVIFAECFWRGSILIPLLWNILTDGQLLGIEGIANCGSCDSESDDDDDDDDDDGFAWIVVFSLSFNHYHH